MIIPGRFNGPPGSGNGGVTCGLLAQATGLSEVTLRQPPPLDRELQLRDAGLYDGDQLIAQAAAGEITVSPIASVTVAEAALATASYAGWSGHPFPTCFVCGPDNDQGLRLFPGAVRDGVVATPWLPVDEDPVLVWAALDCPSGWSTDLPGRPLVLGRMTCRIDTLPTPDVDHVVMGWHVGDEGRKVFTASALYTAAGEVLAVAQQTWIAVNS